MKKLLIFIIAGIFLIGTISALDILPTKNYVKDLNEKYGKIEINNFLGIGGKLKDVELTYNTEYHIGRPYSEGITTMYSRGKLFDEITFRADRNSAKYFEKNYRILIGEKKTREVQVPVYAETCLMNTNNSLRCEEELNYYETKQEEYIDYNRKYKFEDVDAGVYYWRIEGNLNPYESVDWVPVLNGIKGTEWAAWNSSFDSGLTHVWNFENETATESSDEMNATTGVTIINDCVYKPGKNGNALYCPGTTGSDRNWANVSNGYGLLSTTGSMNCWVNSTGRLTYGEHYFASDGWNSFGLSKDNTTEIYIGSGQNSRTGLTTDLGETYSMVTVTWNTSHFSVYVNGSIVDNNHVGGTIETDQWVFGTNRLNGGGWLNPFKGEIDECYVWDRRLGDSEITSLFDGGTGTFYSREEGWAVISLISPENNSTLSTSSINFTANATVSESYNFTNFTYYIHHGNGTLFNSTTVELNESNEVNATLSVSSFIVDDYFWNVKGCYQNTTSVYCIFGASNYTFNWIPFEVDAETHEEIVLETSRQIFKINITSVEGYTVSNGRLVYNGTIYPHAVKTSIDSDSFEIVQTIYIPGGSSGFETENRTFYWNISITNELTGETISFQTDEYNQTVNELKFQECSAEINVTLLNFTLYNEATGIIINATGNATNFQADFNLGAYAENKVKNYSVNHLSSGNSSFAFCTNDNRTIYLDMNSLISAESYAERNYYLSNSTLTNATSEIPIYLIPEDSALEFFITITKQLQPVEDAYVHVAKYFTGEGTYKTVEVDKTDSNGKFNAYLDLDRDYKATVILDGEVLGIKTFKASCASAPCEISLDIETEAESVFSLIDSLYAQNVLYNLSFNPQTKMVTFEFVDITGLANYFRMYVYNSNSSRDSTLISNQTLYSSSGTILFNATDYSGNFKADVFVSRSPEILISFITFIINEFYDNLGENAGEVLLLAFMLVITFIFGLSFNPSVLIASVPIIIHLGAISGLLPFSPIVITVFYILAILGVAATLSK